jgi:hypothetical protein
MKQADKPARDGPLGASITAVGCGGDDDDDDGSNTGGKGGTSTGGSTPAVRLALALVARPRVARPAPARAALARVAPPLVVLVALAEPAARVASSVVRRRRRKLSPCPYRAPELDTEKRSGKA